MASFRTIAITALTAASVGSATLVTPAFAEQRTRGVDASRLDKAPAEYSQYRRGWGYRGGYYNRGYNRGAAVAAGVGLGILGAAAIASSRRAYADPYYYDDGYYAAPSYGYAPVYAAPPVVYAPAPRYYGRPYGYYPDNIRDPAGGSYVR